MSLCTQTLARAHRRYTTPPVRLLWALCDRASPLVERTAYNKIDPPKLFYRLRDGLLQRFRLAHVRLGRYAGLAGVFGELGGGGFEAVESVPHEFSWSVFVA